MVKRVNLVQFETFSTKIIFGRAALVCLATMISGHVFAYGRAWHQEEHGAHTIGVSSYLVPAYKGGGSMVLLSDINWNWCRFGIPHGILVVGVDGSHF